MPSKNDLSGLLNQTNKVGKSPILPPQKTQKTESTWSKKIGRPKKTPSQKRDYKVALSFTTKEGEIIRAKAGLAGDATYIYAFLEEKGFFQ